MRSAGFKKARSCFRDVSLGLKQDSCKEKNGSKLTDSHEDAVVEKKTSRPWWCLVEEGLCDASVTKHPATNE